MVKKYIIMCGGNYNHWEKPRHLSVINGEELVARTIRLLKENGIKDVSISSNNPVFEKFGIPVLKHDNLYNCKWHDILEGDWFNCFYPTDEPTCYILGDVYFSEEAIKTIINTDTDDIELFGSIPPFAPNYIKNHIEAFALKVANIKHLRDSIEETRELEKQGKFWRKPIIWELWEVIKGNPLQKSKDDEYIYDYKKINDYTCDIDWQEDVRKLEYFLKGGYKVFKCEVIERFTLGKFDELKNIVRKEERNNERHGELFVGDTFECDKNMVDYLTGANDKEKVVVKVIEVTPEELPTNQTGEEVTQVIEEKPKKKKRKTSKR